MLFRPTIVRLLLAAGTCYALAASAGPSSGYRDLNRNGRMDPYEDASLSAEARANDLLGRMTLEEKVGAMMHGTLPAIDMPFGISSKGYDMAAVERLISTNKLNSLLTRLNMGPADFAEQNNSIQRIAERSRLGIPVTVSTDPRSHFQVLAGSSTSSNGFSQWPETLGLAALGDPDATRRFGDIVRREYRAVGIHMALSPQADLATEPRWPRQVNTFGSNPAKVSALVGAYVEGFQHGREGTAADGVATIVKHWVGYGAAPEGFDAHNYYGRIARQNPAGFEDAVAAFRGAFAAQAAGVMPTYSIVEGVMLDGKPLEPVGAGFNKALLTDLLRGREKFRGLVVSDWLITVDCPESCRNASAARPQSIDAIGMPWGVETLSVVDRFAKAANAGVDQIGGVNDGAPLLAAVKAGKVPVARVDEAVKRTMVLKFRQGLFDNAFVEAAAAARIVGDPAGHKEAEAAQRAAQVLLENRKNTLPVAPSGRKIWLYKIDPAAARRAGFVVVTDLAQAEVAALRISTPSEKLHPFYFFGNLMAEGRLDFRVDDPDYKAVASAAQSVPTIVAVNMDRPAILTNIRDKATALLAVFGASDDAVLDVITGRGVARGRLPFDLPSSAAEVDSQDPAVPDDTAHPLYREGAGIALTGSNPG